MEPAMPLPSPANAQQGMSATAPDPHLVPGGYEFDPEQNKVFQYAGSAIEACGTLMMAKFGVAVLTALVIGVGFSSLLSSEASSRLAVVALPAMVGALLVGLGSLLLGVWTRRAGRSFKEVAETQGDDIGSVMSAMRDLTRVFSLLRTFFIVVIVLMVLWLLLAIMM